MYPGRFDFGDRIGHDVLLDNGHLIELAHKGPLFLDEITSLSYPFQAKLLRLLSENEILKLGSSRIIPVEIRFIAATNSDIEADVSTQNFRRDLYDRLSAFRLHIPPLRDRPEDLAPLFLHCVRGIRKEILKEVAQREKDIHEVLVTPLFEGNVRELENMARRFCVLYQPEDHGQEVAGVLETCVDGKGNPSEQGEPSGDLRAALGLTEKGIIQELVRRHRSKNDISRILNIDGSTLWRKMKRYGISD